MLKINVLLRRCSKCVEYQSVRRFYRWSQKSFRWQSYCIPCFKKDKDSRYPEYYEKNKSRIRRVAREYSRRKRTGCTPEEFSQRLKFQNSRCAICETPIDEHTAHADHCHVSKKMRGLLCHGCNTGLGLFKEDIKSLMNASLYLLSSLNQ